MLPEDRAKMGHQTRLSGGSKISRSQRTLTTSERRRRMTMEVRLPWFRADLDFLIAGMRRTQVFGLWVDNSPVKGHSIHDIRTTSQHLAFKRLL